MARASLDYTTVDYTTATAKIVAVSFEVKGSEGGNNTIKQNIENWITTNTTGAGAISDLMNYSVTWKKDGNNDYAIVSVTQKK